MNPDFHYYAAYCASILAGYSHEEAVAVAYSDCFVDSCSRTLLLKLNAPLAAATTQLKLELMDARTDISGLQDITRIWSSFHFLPYDLTAKPAWKCSKRYLNKYRLICNPNSALLKETVQLAKGKSPQAAGIAMHVLSDTWAHRYFAGTPSLAINNTNYYFYELFDNASEKQLRFRHSAFTPDDLDNSLYTASIYVNSENSIMNLGHGRAGHLPDYSFVRYKYLPAWGNYEEIVKDNPSDYQNAFCQMVYALEFLRGKHQEFQCGVYATDTVADVAQEVSRILHTRQLDDSADWKALGERLSGQAIPDFSIETHQAEYLHTSGDKDNTFLGKFILAALAQKSMVTNRIYQSGNPLAGVSINYRKEGFGGIRAFRKLLREGKP